MALVVITVVCGVQGGEAAQVRGQAQPARLAQGGGRLRPDRFAAVAGGGAQGGHRNALQSGQGHARRPR